MVRIVSRFWIANVRLVKPFEFIKFIYDKTFIGFKSINLQHTPKSDSLRSPLGTLSNTISNTQSDTPSNTTGS